MPQQDLQVSKNSPHPCRGSLRVSGHRAATWLLPLKASGGMTAPATSPLILRTCAWPRGCAGDELLGFQHGIRTVFRGMHAAMKCRHILKFQV